MSIRTYFEDIADAIREVSGSSDTYNPAQMPDAIKNISPIETIENFQVTVIGGYNGNAPIIVYVNGVEKFRAIGVPFYNLSYNPSGGTIVVGNESVNVIITPPEGQSSSYYLTVKLTGDITFNTPAIYPLGNNQSFGYNYDSGVISV